LEVVGVPVELFRREDGEWKFRGTVITTDYVLAL
jgi:hypothetical protein